MLKINSIVIQKYLRSIYNLVINIFIFFDNFIEKAEYKHDSIRIINFNIILAIKIPISDIVELNKIDWIEYFTTECHMGQIWGYRIKSKLILIHKRSGFNKYFYIMTNDKDTIYDEILKGFNSYKAEHKCPENQMH